jgi:hypothetical protein
MDSMAHLEFSSDSLEGAGFVCDNIIDASDRPESFDQLHCTKDAEANKGTL